MTSITGFILIDKPEGVTSHDIVYKMRKITHIKKIGHAGTLDPLASGLLIIAIGRESTKQISQYIKMDKEYIAEIELGFTTNTYDREGKLRESKNIDKFEYSATKINRVVKSFIGEQEQTPPMFSAKKVKGEKLYNLARQGIKIERKAEIILISKIKIVDYNWPKLEIKISCSSGTYIRTLAHDIGQRLGCGAYLKNLRRTRIGKFNIKKAVKISDLKSEKWEEYLFS